MSKLKEKAVDFVLPIAIITKVDVSRLVTEVEKVDNELTTAAVRAKKGSRKHAQPILSQQLTDFLESNKTELSNSQARRELIKQLRTLKDKVPIIHMTFAAQADRESLQQLTQWLRSSIHPQAVIEVGLQPALVAGVYMRTPNHVYDLSLRALLQGKHESLVKELGAFCGRN